MGEIAANGLRLVEEDEATGEVAALYEEIKRELLVPEVPNVFKALGASPGALAIFWSWFGALYKHTTLDFPGHGNELLDRERVSRTLDC